MCFNVAMSAALAEVRQEVSAVLVLFMNFRPYVSLGDWPTLCSVLIFSMFF